MSGFEEEWIYIKDNTSTTYTNLPPGNYTFEVRCTNENNSWSEKITRLKIKIAPPWYLSWGAFLLYFITFNAGIYFFLRYYTRKIKMKKEIEVANLLVEKEKELSEKKLSFFTNISHDLKTPLTLITAPLDQVITSPNLPEEHINNLLIIKRNALKLRTLINDILDFRKITNKQIALNITPTDLNSLLNSLYSSFNNSCKQRNITLTIHCNVDQKVFIDSEKIEKILWNLLSNALKFTNSNGTISLHAKLNLNDILEISVKDTGKGIKKEERPKIFNRFYQSDNYAPEENTGSGIGLSIVKELVQVHKGKINVHSVYGEGTEFILEVPADKNSYPKEIITENQPHKKDPVNPQETAETNKKLHTANRHKNQNILIAEDNEDLLDFLQQYFKHSYNVSTVKNGKEALDQVNRKQPDLIISDIMMPRMNGVSLCNNIKTNFDTSHIPIILLTADSSDERKIAGMEVRADAYVTKPFNIRYLDALVNSLIQNRVKLKEHFLGLKINKHSDDALTKEDHLFIENFQSFINENYSSPDLDVDKMAVHMACSRSQFNRKVKALLGITPSNLLKQVRLKKAYELLKNDQISVSEAAFKTGFC
jgi:signal transduction histidine kinase/CheY-like chemotaxis protein/AraC-like DNA-binding protein